MVVNPILACAPHRPFLINGEHGADAAPDEKRGVDGAAEMPEVHADASDADAGEPRLDTGARDAEIGSDAVPRDAVSDMIVDSPPDRGIDVLADVALDSPLEPDTHPDSVPDLPRETVTLLGAGAICTRGEDCMLGYCTDGVCCDRACDGQCESCNQTGHLGTCQAVVGPPSPAREPCGGTGACAGGCDGRNGHGCVFPDNHTNCGAPRCNDGKITDNAACDGKGACVTPASTACMSNLCADETRCAGGCGPGLPCGPGRYCDATGVCLLLRDLGAQCHNDNECNSTFCTDGVCCSARCAGQCEACNEPTRIGQCLTVSGAPRDSRPSCNGVGGGCAGTCDGSSATACAYPVGSTVCVPAFCSGDESAVVSASVCNGVGACTGVSSIPCGDAAYCSNGTCTSRLAIGASCQSTIECASNNCSNGLCCAAGRTNCNGTCVDLAGDDANCGTCGFACTAGQRQCRSGQCLLDDGQPCSTAADCAGGICRAYYRDADQDGYGVTPLTMLCGGVPPAGYSASGGDCCDSNPGMNPAAGFADSIANCNGTLTWDWNCSGKVETSLQYFYCSPVNCTSSSGAFPDTSLCGQQYTATRCEGSTTTSCHPATIFIQPLKCN